MENKTYLLYDGKYFKIGRTLNINNRLKVIKSNNPDTILLSYSNKDVENILHKKYFQYSYHNEWFRIDNINIIDELIKDFDIKINDIKDFNKIKIKNVNPNRISQKIGSQSAAKINGTLRTNRTRETIQKAKYELGIRNMKITQKEVAKYTGLGIATIKRNWTLDKKEINVEIPEIIESIKEPILEVIEEEKFFNDTCIEKDNKVSEIEDMRVIEYNYKGFDKVTLILTKKDKEDFKNAIKRLEKNGFEICLSTLELCGLDKYKLEYLYNIWYNKNNNK